MRPISRYFASFCFCSWGLQLGCSAEVGQGTKQASPNNGLGAPGSSPTAPGTDPSGSPTGSSTTGGPGNVTPPPVTAILGPTALRRLTDLEYRNTVKALLSLPALPTEPLQPDAWSNGFNNFGTALAVPPTQASQYADLAAKYAQSFAAPACTPPMVDADCAAGFITGFGKQAFRRPLTPAEQQQYQTVYSDERARKDHASGVRLVVETMLQSGNLLYRFELGDAAQGPRRTLSNYEVAGELSYMLSASTPDASLLAAADAGQLQTPAQIEQAARRLLALPGARDALRLFVESFAGVGRVDEVMKDPVVYPSFTAELRMAMHEETGRFINAIVSDGDGTFTSLMTAPYSIVNSSLSKFYGISDPGPGFSKASLNPLERAGLLTQASVLAAHSKAGESFPIARGKFVRVGLLCQTLPAPPANVPPSPVPNPNLTTRERFSAHSADPACSGCHALIDPIGFGLENYDGIGQFRTTENGKPVDASGLLTSTRDIDGAFKGGVELAMKLASSAESKACLALQAYRWAFGRREVDGEGAVTEAMAQSLAAGGLDVRELAVAITKSDNFLFRSFR